MNGPTQVPRDESLEWVEEFSAELAKPTVFDEILDVEALFKEVD